ncbi:urease accessory protein UreD [Phormidium sp. FACHB-592]|uniref:Urease accessory protein UreD n=1 Tax=Stenomitos frigidus AS-A4 TaxID=2933935 RepID=A0ABV0KMI0_9CYAN|nr:urease accessory protein UreD [Phormidium sp. FACHB-592]MBD2077071.1 urease accessory protein UreD [Phormidium sp. FACHB-592]
METIIKDRQTADSAAERSDPSTVAFGRTSSNQLAVQIGLDHYHQSFVQRQYATYPFRLSRALRLDPTDAHRTYLYIMNSSPGLLAGDAFQMSVRLSDRTALYLTDQSATKVHQMAVEQSARVHYEVAVGSGASLEYVPEPIILYRNASLKQTMRITLAPTGSLFLSDIMVPGRLARGEYFHFRQYVNRLQVYTPAGDLVFTDAMQLKGQGDRPHAAEPDRTSFDRASQSPLFSPYPILASLLLVLPEIDLQPLSQDLAQFAQVQTNLTAASSPLPNCNGLWLRAMAGSVSIAKTYINYALTRMRHLNGQPSLPEVPK